jgi:hypothetical protein
MAHWGLLANRHKTSLINFNFNPRVCFLRLLFARFVRAVVRKTDFKRGYDTTIFHLYSGSCEHSEWLVL